MKTIRIYHDPERVARGLTGFKALRVEDAETGKPIPVSRITIEVDVQLGIQVAHLTIPHPQVDLELPPEQLTARGSGGRTPPEHEHAIRRLIDAIRGSRRRA